MNTKLEELSKKLENELATQQANERHKEFVESEAVAAGIWGAIKYGIGYGLGGFIIGGIVGIFANNAIALIIFLGGIVFGVFIGYSEESQNKRNYLNGRND